MLKPATETAFSSGRFSLLLRDRIARFFRKDLFHDLEQSKTAEQGSLALLQAILDNTVDGLITIDQRGIIQTYNKACEKIFGYKAAETAGQNVSMLMPEPYRAEHDGYLHNYQATGKKRIIGIGREVQGRRKDGTVFPLDLSVSEVNLGARKIYSGIVRDITERKKAEEEILRSNTELERFAYVSSHDLQEPLRMIANFTSLLKEEYGADFDSQARQYMDFITDAVRRMQEMVSDLLEYSRIGYEDSGFQEIDCNVQAGIALENLRDAIRETEAKITIGKLPVLSANPVRFSRLIQNLIGNAIKYRHENRIPEIRVDATEREGEWLFHVRDNGIGIKEEYLEQIFIIFKRLHSKNDYRGTGIGLAICKKIVDAFGGQIWAESAFGESTTVYFTVPKNT